MKNHLKRIPRYYERHLALFIILMGCGVALLAQPTSQTFNSNGSYTVPAGYTAVVKIEAWGGGGGGGGVFTGLNARGGGGGGAYASSTITLLPGAYAVTVGTGGAEGINGGNSTFNGTTVVAEGGFAPTIINYGSPGGRIANSVGDVKFAGGSGGNAYSEAGGGGGGASASPTANGDHGHTPMNPGQNNGGGGGTGWGTPVQGGGGRGGVTNGNGQPGLLVGGGGGGRGASSTATPMVSGAGANGRVVVTVLQFALPVKYNDISARIMGGQLQVKWSTGSENNNRLFEVLASNDGREFKKIGEVETKAFNGNSNSVIHYSFDMPVKGIAAMFGVSLFGLALIFAGNKRKKMQWLLPMFVLGIVVTAAACSKREAPIDITNEGKIFVKIVQVDIDGERVSSEVVTAYKAD